MEQGLGNGSNAPCVCLDSSWGKFTTPSHLGFFSPPSSSLKRSQSQTAIAGLEEVVLASRVQGSKQRGMERASLELHVLSRDLPWRALEKQEGQGKRVNSLLSLQSDKSCLYNKIIYDK